MLLDQKVEKDLHYLHVLKCFSGSEGETEKHEDTEFWIRT